MKRLVQSLLRAARLQPATSAAQKLPQLIMLRPHLEDLPAIDLPPGYELRHFRTGDEQGWNALMAAAFERDPGYFDFAKMMAPDPAFAPERVKLVCAAGGELVATASAWHAEKYGSQRGILHWVATHPVHRGKRLGHWVSVAAMHQARSEGRSSMHLLTDDHRLAALSTYLRLGFRPELTHPSHPARWQRALEQLGCLKEYEELLKGPLSTLHP